MYNYAINEYVNRKKTKENHPYSTQNLIAINFSSYFFLCICTCISHIEKTKIILHILFCILFNIHHEIFSYIYIF